MSFVRRTNLAAGILLAALAFCALAWLIPANTQPAQSARDLAPAFMPTLAMSVCLGLSLLLAVRNRPRGTARELEHEEFGAEASGIGRQELTNLALWLALVVLTMLLLHFAGFIPAGIVLLALSMWYVGLRRPLLLVPLCLGVPVALYWVVWFAFTIELP